MTIRTRLKQAREHAGLTQDELAERSGVPQSTIANLESGAAKSSRSTVTLAIACGVRPEWLAVGEGPMVEADVVPGPPITNTVPLVSWVAAGGWNEAADPHPVGQGEAMIPTTKRVGPRAFALRVRGDSMVNPHGRPTYPEGSIIIVDPDLAATPGKRVVARLTGENEATFKQLVQDGARLYLKPLNPQYPAIPIDERTSIVGVVVQTILDED